MAANRQLNSRVTDDLHELVTVCASESGVSLNEWVNAVLRKAVSDEMGGVEIVETKIIQTRRLEL